MRTKPELRELALEWLRARGMNDAKRLASLTELLERVQDDAARRAHAAGKTERSAEIRALLEIDDG